MSDPGKRLIQIEATRNLLRSSRQVEVPNEFGAAYAMLMESVIAQHECLLEILGELRALRDMATDATAADLP